MQVTLAGFNIDKKLIDKLGNDISATPEVISAAYARISRSSKSVTELRSAAIKDVAKARTSNWEIVFEMGHASVAEHAVFNFDIIGISRYLAEFIQRSRLASFTEKSQRYVTMDGDYVMPAEIEQSSLKDGFVNLMERSFALYSDLFNQLKQQKEKEREWSSERELEGAAKEDSRYVLPLCTKTQMGMTINARSFLNCCSAAWQPCLCRKQRNCTRCYTTKSAPLLLPLSVLFHPMNLPIKKWTGKLNPLPATFPTTISSYCILPIIPMIPSWLPCF
jgi:flavin-dependent thymidylate synthase